LQGVCFVLESSPSAAVGKEYEDIFIYIQGGGEETVPGGAGGGGPG
jgi:hypothetical protein